MGQKNNLPLFLFTVFLTSWHHRGVILQSLSWRKCSGGEKSTTSHLYWETRELLPAVSYVFCAPSDRPVMQPQISALCRKHMACLTREDQTDLERCPWRWIIKLWAFYPLGWYPTIGRHEFFLFPRGWIVVIPLLSSSATMRFTFVVLTAMSQQLLEGNLVQKFMFTSGWIVIVQSSTIISVSVCPILQYWFMAKYLLN